MSMPIDFDLFREVSLIHQKHADWEAITTLSIDDPSYDTYAAGFKTAVGVIEQYITNLKAAKPEQAETAVGLPENFCATMPTGRGTGEETDELNIYVKCGTLLYTADQMESYATAKTAEAVRELMDCLAQAHDLSLDGTNYAARIVKVEMLAKHEPSNGKA